jgi:hypothetical protein
METLTIVLLVAIMIFLIGIILLFILERRQKNKEAKKLPLGSASQEVLNSKVEVLNKRVSRLEDKDKKKPRTIKAIIKKDKAKGKFPITKYKRKKNV